MGSLLPWLFGGLALFVGVWLLVVVVLARSSGWSTLAIRYAGHGREPESRLRHQVAHLGRARYKGVLTLGFSEGALHLEVLAPFRPGHPPLAIPWADVHEVGRTAVGSAVWVRVDVGGQDLIVPAAAWDRRPPGAAPDRSESRPPATPCDR